MAAILTIGTTTYPNIAMIEDTFDLTENLQERGRLQCDVIDYVGVHFVRGEQVTVTDPVRGIVFAGYINTDKETPQYPSGWILHTIDCIGQHYLTDKRSYTATYQTTALSSKIAVDILSNVLSAEGIVPNYAAHEDATVVDFSQGILNNTQGVIDTNGNTWLELTSAGSNLTIAENTTTTFSTGTLNNITASNNELIPTTVSGLKMQATLPFSQPFPFLNINIWSGSQALATNDILNYLIDISSTSPGSFCSVGLTFTDGTSTTGITDQNGYAIDSSTDISAKAKDNWYPRAFSLSSYNGKTVKYVYVSFGGSSVGTYTCFVQNINLSSGTVFFSTAATSTQLNPVVVASSEGYAPTSIIAQVLPVKVANTYRISPAYSIDPVKLLSSSSINWKAALPASSTATILVSYDGGTTYQQCANGATLPALPAGSNLTGLTLTLWEQLKLGTDPSQIPTLSQVTVNLNSAPAATKSDSVTTYANTSAWNTGTFNNTQTATDITAAGNLESGSITNGWNQGQIINQTFYFTNSTTDLQSVSSGTYSITLPVSTSSNHLAAARLTWAGTVTRPLVIDMDVSIPNTYNYSSWIQIAYLQTYWGGWGEGTNAYTLRVGQGSQAQNNIYLLRGSNSSTNSSTTLASVSQNAPNHIRITVSTTGVHNIYFDNNNTTPVLTATDTTYTSGGVGIGAIIFFQNPGGGGTGTFTYKNPVISPLPVCTWTSPSVSVSSLGTCGGSVISWTEYNTPNAPDNPSAANAAIFVQSSIDGGSTYQTCTSGATIPGLTAGVNLSGKTVQLLVNFYANPSNFYLPQLSQLVYRVLGAYPGSSGTRATIPLGNDTMVRSNVGSGWGTGFDSQTYTQIGTGTTALTSNEGTIANTTGDVHMRYGSRTYTDEDGTCRFALSASTISAGIELRYVDANNWYRLSASTTGVSLIKCVSGSVSTLASVSMTIPINTYYNMRFRVYGSNPFAYLFGNVWAANTLEPTISATTGAWNNALWTITATDQ